MKPFVTIHGAPFSVRDCNQIVDDNGHTVAVVVIREDHSLPRESMLNDARFMANVFAAAPELMNILADLINGPSINLSEHNPKVIHARELLGSLSLQANS